MSKLFMCKECGHVIKEEWINKGTPETDCGACPHYGGSVELYTEDDKLAETLEAQCGGGGK